MVKWLIKTFEVRQENGTVLGHLHRECELETDVVPRVGEFVTFVERGTVPEQIGVQEPMEVLRVEHRANWESPTTRLEVAARASLLSIQVLKGQPEWIDADN